MFGGRGEGGRQGRSRQGAAGGNREPGLRRGVVVGRPLGWRSTEHGTDPCRPATARHFLPGQAQRDFFGSHTYERTDGKAGWFHTVWDPTFG